MSTNGDVRVSGPIRRVMVGTDRSETAERAVAWAAAFADRYEADLHIVQVILPGSPTDTEFGAAEATRARGAADELQIYATQIAGQRGRSHVVIDDDPAMAIVDATEEHRSTSWSSGTPAWRAARSSCSATSRTASATTPAAR